MKKRDADRAREQHPDAEMLMHPECHPSIVALADFVGSTTEIMSYAEKGEHREYIIDTEKSFYPLSTDCVCHNMSATTLMDVYRTVKGIGGEEIVMSDDLITDSRKCIDEMLRLGQ